MSALAPPLKPVVHYPDDDGEPMSDNTRQFDWIAILKWNLEILFAADENVFVAGNHLIYPVEGDADTKQAPDTYVAFGRPKGDRGSYKVWDEGGTFPQVIFEVWSPSNDAPRMEFKRQFYEKHGAEEYYVVYPDFPAHAEAWRREGGKLVRVADLAGWVSPRLGIRFVLADGELTVFGPGGRAFVTPSELATALTEERDEARRRATEEHDRAETERLRAEAVKRRAADAERQAVAERQRAEAERERAEAEKQRAEKLAARLRELGIDPDTL